MSDQGNAGSGDGRDRAGWYPVVDARAQGLLSVGDGHRLYWEESGDPAGIPVLYVHGGPGAGSAPAYRRFFDPRRYRIILFDQRGCGRSEPFAGLHANTTDHLIADIERLRLHLGVERWLLFGGSWGSTLALAYGQAHPERVLGFVLRGVFLFRRREVEWFLTGMGRFFPAAGRAFYEHLPASERATPLESYYRRLTDPDPAVHGPAARAWTAYEDACSRFAPRGPLAPMPSPPACQTETGGRISTLPMARIEAHYMMHEGFLREGQLLDGIERVAHLPCTIVQGRYDMVCPIESADAVHRAWPLSRLVVVPDAGHSALEPGTRAALVAAVDAFAARLQGEAGGRRAAP